MSPKVEYTGQPGEWLPHTGPQRYHQTKGANGSITYQLIPNEGLPDGIGASATNPLTSLSQGFTVPWSSTGQLTQQPNPQDTMAKKKTPKPATEAPAATPTPPPAAPAPVAEVEAATPAQPKQNGITRPKDGTVTGRVWAISDEISAATKAPALRKPVLEKCAAESINPATATTQYGKWRRFNGLKGRGTEAAA